MDTQAPPKPSAAKICKRCSEIDFDKLLSEPVNGRRVWQRVENTIITEAPDGPNLGRIALYDKSLCDLCDFFDVLPDEAKQGDYVYCTYRLRSRWSRDSGESEIRFSVPNCASICASIFGSFSSDFHVRSKNLNETLPAVDTIVLCLDPSPRRTMNHVLNCPRIP